MSLSKMIVRMVSVAAILKTFGLRRFLLSLFFFNDTATTEIYTLPYTTLFRSPQPTFPRANWVGISTIFSPTVRAVWPRSEEHTSELQSQSNLVCRLLLEKKKKNKYKHNKKTKPQ